MGNETPTRVVGYYVVFPHIPDETVENNSFLSNIAMGRDWPTLSTSSPKEMYEGTVRMLMEYGATCMEHLELIEKLPPEERTFETVVEPLLTEEYDVDYALQTLLLKMLTDWPDCNRNVFDADLHHIMSARDRMEKLSSLNFQIAIKQLYDAKNGLSTWQLRLLEWYLLEVRASGLDITDEKSRKLIGSWNKFIDEFRSNSNIMATNDQHIFTASFDHDFYNNSINVEELRHNNEGLAKALGYTSVAEHRLANKMATSPETVRNFLNALTRRIRPVFIDRMESWTAFAQTQELMSSNLQAYDMAYICRKEAEQLYDVDPLDLMGHFPFWPTFQKLTNITEQIFGLHFKDVTDEGLERVHSDVRIFSVKDLATDEHLGRLYIDPYDRENKRGGWNALLGRMESKARNLDKIVYLVGSAIAPTHTAPSLLHHQQLQQLLFYVGRSLQMLLSRSPYRDIAIPWAPFYASDWDAADAVPAFLQFFVYKPTLLQSLSSPHIVSDTTISDDRANNICLALSRATLWDSYRTLFWSDFDLTVFEMEDRKCVASYFVCNFGFNFIGLELFRQKFWLDLYREMSEEYFPFKTSRNDYHPCSFIPIFGLQPYMGMYYRKLWTEMLALDIHETFDFENDVRKTGDRLKATILSRGSGDMAKELYRRFQGRDPSVVMASIATTAAGDTKTPEVTVVTEVPPSLHRALLLMAKNFFSKEHYLVVYYIMRSVCIREEILRNRLNFEQRHLRQLIAALKNEKLVKDRLLQQKNETGRNVSIIFYFINYRAIINVLKYKIDHMRLDMDIDRIFDTQTGTLKCWRCQGEVTQDITGGPTQVTRTLLARFNEQMLPLFAAIRELAGIQLAPHLLEPDINQYLAEEDKSISYFMMIFTALVWISLGHLSWRTYFGYEQYVKLAMHP
ncbi:unnamed protein product [Angiostrongylus costaricensis]|uniref:HTH TFE/IIEalpha-type domain-containing protein n=1 Tax=Angiostrongylus costaricensis TaxID=334426 RepID=A0A158PJ72_ANGCS|nr:unnamed protein product [Angiostrongylus costaricensis]